VWKIIKPERIKLALSFETIEIEMIQLHRFCFTVNLARTFVFMNEGKGWTRHFIWFGGGESFGNSLHQSGFSSAQIAAQNQKLRRSKQFGDLVANAESYLRWLLLSNEWTFTSTV